MNIRIHIKVCLLLLLGVPTGLLGQTDSLTRPATDTLPADSVAQSGLLIKGGVSGPVKGGTPTPAAPAVNDTLTRRSLLSGNPKLQKLSAAARKQLPYVYTKDEKYRIHIPIFWREDIDLPWTRAFQPAGARPPFDPEMAWQRSLILPGWGQAYNKSYWKIPVFYAGYAGFIWWIDLNQKQYVRFGDNYLCKLEVTPGCTLDPELSRYDAEGLRRQRDTYRRYRDFGIVFMCGWHLVQVAEAYVDAHLNGFDVSDDLGWQFRPSLSPAGPSGYAGGFSLVRRF
ncbi:MAG: hypothetical protein EAZ89_09185 [Bacteroidetes bacterium]|nr:MAG: hypothetical protein EAZ89_09185 [Bacteroidota bacterium]